MKHISLFFSVLLLVPHTQSHGSGIITGQGRFEKIAGQPAAGYKYLYEADLFLCGPDDAMIGPARRLGAPPGQQPTGDGYYRIENLPAGCAVYKRNKDSLSYAHGRAYDQNGNAKDFDLNCTVFVDRNGKVVTHTRVSSGPGVFDGNDNDTQWGQSLVAAGTSLAAADLFNANGSEPFTLTWRVFIDGPGGTQVGPTKITEGAYFASSTDLAGVCYGRAEVPLTPGRTYYIEMSHPGGFTPYHQEEWQRYDDGQAFRRGAPVDADWAMSIVEYVPDNIPHRPIDINNDGQVNLVDFGIFGGQWGTNGSQLKADFDNDGKVDILDLGHLVSGIFNGKTLLSE